LVGVPGAMRAFEEAHFTNLPTHLAHLTLTADLLEEVAQTLRAKLFVATGGRPPGIAAYSGRGPLGAWFRVTALNAALSLLRAEAKALHPHRPTSAQRSSDPERELIRTRMRTELQDTLRDVLAQTPARERALLRLHFVNGSTLEELTQAFKVSRATVVRWIASARRSVLQETQRRMVQQLKLSPSQLSSTLRISRSDWSLSLETVLGSEKK
jgi:RNA polymerase sigma-70 factor, ECF subfamily